MSDLQQYVLLVSQQLKLRQDLLSCWSPLQVALEVEV
jgi:hypothetical protein